MVDSEYKPKFCQCSEGVSNLKLYAVKQPNEPDGEEESQ
jgi:hypothetical protein